MTGETAFRSRALRWVQHGSSLALVIGLIATVVYIITRLQAGYVLERDVRQFQEVQQIRQERAAVVYQQLLKDIQDLKSTVYGSLEPQLEEAKDAQKRAPAPRRSTPETWQQNRDAELRSLLQDMQRRQLQLEAELYELKRKPR